MQIPLEVTFQACGNELCLQTFHAEAVGAGDDPLHYTRSTRTVTDYCRPFFRIAICPAW